MKIKTIIIGGEKRNQNLLSRLLTTHCSNIDIIGIFDSIEEAKPFNPNIVFLDCSINNKDEINLVKDFFDHPFVTIFITQYDQNKVELFKNGNMHYMLKPFSIARLKKTVESALKKIRTKTNNEIKILSDKLILNRNYKSISIDYNQVMYIVADEPYCRFVLDNCSKILIPFSLTSMLDVLPEYFFKIHRSHIININQIVHWDSNGRGGKVTLKNGDRLAIAYRIKKTFREIMSKQTL